LEEATAQWPTRLNFLVLLSAFAFAADQVVWSWGCWLRRVSVVARIEVKNDAESLAITLTRCKNRSRKWSAGNLSKKTPMAGR
jgi:hypothetical protein